MEKGEEEEEEEVEVRRREENKGGWRRCFIIKGRRVGG